VWTACHQSLADHSRFLLVFSRLYFHASQNSSSSVAVGVAARVPSYSDVSIFSWTSMSYVNLTRLICFPPYKSFRQPIVFPLRGLDRRRIVNSPSISSISHEERLVIAATDHVLHLQVALSSVAPYSFLQTSSIPAPFWRNIVDIPPASPSLLLAPFSSVLLSQLALCLGAGRRRYR